MQSYKNITSNYNFRAFRGFMESWARFVGGL